MITTIGGGSKKRPGGGGGQIVLLFDRCILNVCNVQLVFMSLENDKCNFPYIWGANISKKIRHALFAYDN